jgi:glycosyltransferase involved in cell wall biosynthesis
MQNDTPDDIELSIVMPCLNEANTLKNCIEKAQKYLKQSGVKGEIVIGDNGSTDGSQQIALSIGVRLIEISERGYGRALMGAFRAARGKYIIMGDSDDSYDFSHLDPFMEKLREGYDLIIGNRFKGEIKPNAMPAINKYVGNPVLSSIGRLFFRSEIGDFHCGLRGFKRESLMSLSLETTGMEFASEMIVKATIHHLKLTEVPVVLSPDGRGRPSYLRPWQDGWRHLKFLLAHSPGPVFLIRELLLMVGGLIRRFAGLFKSDR